MNVAGIDLSMTATGLTHTVAGQPCTHTIKTRDTGDDRLVVIRNEIRTLLEQSFPVDLVLMEDLLNRSMSAGITGMVHGAVRSMLLEYGYRFGVVPPTSLKKYGTGKGGASKTDMAVAALKRDGREFPNDNACDSWWAWVMANDYMDAPVFFLPQVQRDQLKNIKVRSS